MTKPKYEKKICQECKHRFVKCYEGIYSKKCVPCTFKSDKNTVEMKKKICVHCEKEYQPTSYNQKYCLNPCRYNNLKTEAEKWLEKKPRPKNKLDSNQVAYGFFRKKFGVSNVYRVCRG